MAIRQSRWYERTGAIELRSQIRENNSVRESGNSECKCVPISKSDGAKPGPGCWDYFKRLQRSMRG